jgi:2-oxo-4-hydroxy-4-carboxy--5-ureidoimidazoline (OHCU) decarboxylase
VKHFATQQLAAAPPRKQSNHLAARQKPPASDASPETLAVLIAAKQAYQATFGHSFVICAVGMTTEDVL